MTAAATEEPRPPRNTIPVAQGDEVPGSYPSSFIVVDSNLGDHPFRNIVTQKCNGSFSKIIP